MESKQLTSAEYQLLSSELHAGLRRILRKSHLAMDDHESAAVASEAPLKMSDTRPRGRPRGPCSKVRNLATYKLVENFNSVIQGWTDAELRKNPFGPLKNLHPSNHEIQYYKAQMIDKFADAPEEDPCVKCQERGLKCQKSWNPYDRSGRATKFGDQAWIKTTRCSGCLRVADGKCHGSKDTDFRKALRYPAGTARLIGPTKRTRNDRVQDEKVGVQDQQVGVQDQQVGVEDQQVGVQDQKVRYQEQQVQGESIQLAASISSAKPSHLRKDVPVIFRGLKLLPMPQGTTFELYIPAVVGGRRCEPGDTVRSEDLTNRQLQAQLDAVDSMTARVAYSDFSATTWSDAQVVQSNQSQSHVFGASRYPAQSSLRAQGSPALGRDDRADVLERDFRPPPGGSRNDGRAVPNVQPARASRVLESPSDDETMVVPEKARPVTPRAMQGKREASDDADSNILFKVPVHKRAKKGGTNH
ncbi:hypothetical protein MBM_05365 [Drepanopeziza brunnea f. sp. 'multigermtubi' MB_m1]|uniref:Uncharacterized protein n=1 Tax=Marssonina brunnea f. sp. multigermtubi (strain MB_m1) TaxID=1072389 RepID=K1WV04_MARBU|nr:uncharacterized protein MBM_05365 [Drepanopeziza brunnea f. sp. 'multigermtubi' MB_m1]EKD16896.1 hypothetical protein MBM_05365 [Drepanopeziza brunnea f. sp. 'multigermtubi' MB_m1]